MITPVCLARGKVPSKEESAWTVPAGHAATLKTVVTQSLASGGEGDETFLNIRVTPKGIKEGEAPILIFAPEKQVNPKIDEPQLALAEGDIVSWWGQNCYAYISGIDTDIASN